MRTKPGRSCRSKPHIWLSASRRLAIQPSPAHAAVANPMMPTDVRDSIAESISSTSCCPRSPDTVDLILLGDVGEQIRLAGEDEPGDRESDHQQRKEREDGEVGDARGVEVALAVLIALLRAHDVVEPLVPRAEAVQDSRFGRFGHADLPKALLRLLQKT